MPSVSLAHLLDEHHQHGQFTMVVKTETCSFSEFKIFPGHGKMFIEKMGKTHRFINAKCESLHHQRKKAQKLTWTCMWRRLHKRRAEKPSVRNAQRAETSRKIKERRKTRSKTVKRSARGNQKATKNHGKSSRNNQSVRR